MVAAFLCLLMAQASPAGGLRALTTIYLPDSLCGISTPSCLLPVPSHGKIYVGSDYDGYVIAVDTRTRQKVARISVGKFVSKMLYVPQTDRVYCVNTGDSTITVIDPQRDSVVATVDVGRLPRNAAYCPLNGRLYCQTYKPSGVAVVDCNSNQAVKQLEAGAGWGAICCDSARNKMYVADGHSNNVYVVDCARDSVIAVFRTLQEPSHLYYSRRHDKVYVAGNSGHVAVIGCDRDSIVASVETEWAAGGCLAGDDERDLLYMGDPRGKVYIIDCARDRLVDLVEVGRRIGPLVLDPVANRLYCALVDDIDEEEKRPSRSLAVIDCDGRTLVTTLAGRADPNSGSVAWDSLTGDIYLTNPSTPLVTVVDPKTASLAATVTLGCRPGPIVYSPKSRQLYCAEEWGTTLFSIDVPANHLRRSLALGRGTGALCLNSDSSVLYCVGGGDASYLTVIDCRNDSILCAVWLHGWTGAGCFNPADSCIYCAEGDSIAILDGRSGARVARVQVHDCGQPCCASDLNRVFAPSVSMVAAIDGRTHAAAARIAVGNEARALYYDSVGRKLYCSNGGSDNISVIDAESCKYLRTILTLGSPDELVGDAAMRLLYCGQSDARSVAVIDMDRDSVVAQVKVGLQPDHLVAVPGLLLCASRDGARTMVIDTKTLRVVDSLSIGGNADHMVCEPQLRRLYVANSAGSSITVLEYTGQ